MSPLDAPQPLRGVTLDHVAIAVADPAAAHRWWSDLGAVAVAGIALPTFATEQLRLSNHAKVELISRGTDDEAAFIDGFLQRFGSGVVHHITLKVPAPLDASVAQLRDAGMDVVDVNTTDPHWNESFLRPSQVGGVIVQVAWADGTDEDFARRQGRPAPADVDPAAPALEEVVLGHPDLDRAMAVWTLLGADVTPADEDGFRATWPASPIAVRVSRQATGGPIGLVMKGYDGPAEGNASMPSVLQP